MEKRQYPAKSLVYLLILAAVLVFSLYNLFSDNAKSWFVSNKSINVNPLYGRVLTSGAGRNLTSYKNSDPSNLDFVIVDESGTETARIRMVPGDIVHFVFLVTLPEPDYFSESNLILNGIYGDSSLREVCSIAQNSIKVSTVTVAVDENADPPVYTYQHSQTWQTLPNEPMVNLGSEDTELSIPVGEIDSINGVLATSGPYAGTYLFLVDVPALYIDTGEEQNDQKCEYYETSDGTWIPVEDSSTGVLIIERCLIINNG